MTPRVFRSPPQPAVLTLLREAALPPPESFTHFFGCGERELPQGVVGLEIYGNDALLRSLAVDPAARGRGCAGALIAQAEQYAQQRGVRRIYLLTTSAADFFARLGYKRLERDEAPGAIRATSEFAALCPVDSVLMTKEVSMATAKQKAAARRNIKKAAKAAQRKRTIAHLSKKTRRALGKQGAKVAKRKRH
jgi:amino-acid N-acetyltransferase